jgi:hypothetical protein
MTTGRVNEIERAIRAMNACCNIYTRQKHWDRFKMALMSLVLIKAHKKKKTHKTMQRETHTHTHTHTNLPKKWGTDSLCLMCRKLSPTHMNREPRLEKYALPLLRGCATHSLHGVVWDMEGHILYPDLTRGASRRGERRGAKKEAFHRSSGTGSRRGRSFIRQRISSSPCIGLNCAVLNLAPFEKRPERS